MDEVLDIVPVINKQKLMLRQYDHLQALANTNLELPGVSPAKMLGRFIQSKGSDLEDAGVMTRVVITADDLYDFLLVASIEALLDGPIISCRSVVVYLSLWDEAAGMFRGIIASRDKTKTVMTVNPKLFGDDWWTGGVIEELPECRTELAGKEYVFQIRVTPYNFTPNHRTFTVVGISDHVPPESFSTNKAQAVSGEGGHPSSSRKNKDVGESDGPNPPGFAAKESGRKRVTKAVTLANRQLKFRFL
ncbi:unnamed protein product [Eruca vesicaria subsp. sativa]|uniref:Uncharacterized protein n=1 Tax=Eruca vesicaria subsp. sativa TaxID=29727 RepID=A0ABC8LT20_ERUVS|nr:unnamed protein product [Eruca vesicaria subsp. sativa]